jgi:uncharacterized protein YbjQ (UPF0145 family)
MRISTLTAALPSDEELGVVYASVEGVNETCFDECLHELKQKAEALGATSLVGLQLVQSQFQWNQRTSLLATAVRNGPPAPPQQ